MNSLILLAAIAGLPVLLALILRVSAVFLFLSVAAGGLLVSYVGDDAGLALGMMVRGQNTTLITQFGLLLLPVVVSLFFLRKTLPKTKILLHLPVLLATGLALAVLALPFLDSNVQAQIFSNYYGNIFKDSQDVIIGAAGIMTLLLMWMTYRHKDDKKHKKH